MGKSGKHSKQEEPEECEDEVFQVEVITKARVFEASSSEEDSNSEEEPLASKKKSKKKKIKRKKKEHRAKWEYFVKWANYDSDASTWEPEENVVTCHRLLESFWEHVGIDDQDYQVGYVVNAKESWIQKEKKRFLKEKEEEEEMRRKKARKKAKKLQSASTKDSQLSTTSSSNQANNSGSDDIPLKIIIPANKRKRAPIVLSDDDDISTKKKEYEHDDRPAKMLRVDASGGKVTITKEKEKSSSQSPSAASSPTSLFSAPSSPEISLQSQLPLPAVVAAAPPPPRPKKTPATAPLKSFRRGPNPHMKILDMPSGTINTSTGISTKQRIAQGALQPTKPTAPPPPAPNPRASLPQLKTSSNSLAPLNLKKTTATTPLTAAGNTFTTYDAHKMPLSPYAQPSTNILNEMSMDLSSDIGNYVPQTGCSRPPTTGHMMTETGPFLGNIVLAGQAAPLIPASRANNSPVPPFSLQRKHSLPVRIPKKWKWSGPLYLHHTGVTRILCNVTFYDLSEPKPMGLRFPVVINLMEKLELLSFHNAVDMGTFLPACSCSDQVARLGPKDVQDVSPIETLIKYMDKHRKVALIPISLDSNLVGHILLFPRSIERLSSTFRIPSELLVKGSLIATLLPWKLTPSQVSTESRKPATLLIPSRARLRPTLESPRWIRAIRTKLTYQHALHVLKFPLELHTFLSSRERPFCIWYEVGDGSKQNAGFETMLLYSIMEQCRASNVGKKADVRVVFVHVGALDTLHRLPALMERRAKTPHLRFYTYGTHESIMPEHWGIREIYPCGGVVTFTPTAILEDPIGTINRIRQLNQHPLWTCYIHPSVLGIISTLCCKGRDPVSVLESGEFRYRNLLMAIERGEVALLHAPPSPLKHVKPNDRKAWILAYSLCKNLNARKSLEFALDVFRVKFANLQESEWVSAMVNLLLLDLSSMQRQPTIMSQYRRYVILHGERDRKHIPVDPVNRYGLEWVTADKFDFKDEFFPTQ